MVRNCEEKKNVILKSFSLSWYWFVVTSINNLYCQSYITSVEEFTRIHKHWISMTPIMFLAQITVRDGFLLRWREIEARNARIFPIVWEIKSFWMEVLLCLTVQHTTSVRLHVQRILLTTRWRYSWYNLPCVSCSLPNLYKSTKRK